MPTGRSATRGGAASLLDPEAARDLPDGHSVAADFRRAAPFRSLARELGESAASLAHRYALSMPGVDTVVLGVKNRAELRECIAAEARGQLPADVVGLIDAQLRSPDS